MIDDYRVSGFHSDAVDLGVRPDSWVEHVQTEQGKFGFHFLDGASNFRARSVVQSAGDGSRYKLAEFESTRIRYRRTARDANSDGDRSARVFVARSGRIRLSQGRDTVTLTPGSMGIVRLDYPMSLEQDGAACGFIFTVPDGSITRRLADSAPLLMDRTRPLVAMLGTQIDLMHEMRAAFSPFEFVKASEGVFHLLECALDEKAAAHVGELGRVADQATMFISTYSDDPSLTPTTLAAQLGWSVRYVSKALREIYDTSPAALLRATRAERARQRLFDPSFRSIEQIWAASGFQSSSAARAAFLERFGKPPSEVRAAGRGAAQPATRGRARPVTYGTGSS